MVNRLRVGALDGYISPAERAYVSYLSSNKRSLLSSGAAGKEDGDRSSTAVAVDRPKPSPTTGKNASSNVRQESPEIPDLPMARPVGGKVVQGPSGSMRNYRLGRRTFLVPSGEHEADIVAGASFIALNAGGDVTFATDPSGRGLVLGAWPARHGADRQVAEIYSWEKLRDLGRFGVVPRGKWTAERPKTGKEKTDLLGKLLGDRVEPLTNQNSPYSMITLHHTGDHTADSVMRLHLNKISPGERILRKVGSKLGLAQSYDSYSDIGYNFLIDDDGRIYEGRSMKVEGAHVGGHNRGNVGIAVLGDYSSRPLNSAQVRAIEFLVGTLKRGWVTPNERGGGELSNSGFLYTHGEFSPAKRDELKGAQRQLDELSRRLQGSYRQR